MMISFVKHFQVFVYLKKPVLVENSIVRDGIKAEDTAV